MDLQGAAAKRAGIVLLLAICAGVGVAIAGIPTSVGSPRPIRLDAAVSSSSTTTTQPGASTGSVPSTTAGPRYGRRAFRSCS